MLSYTLLVNIGTTIFLLRRAKSAVDLYYKRMYRNVSFAMNASIFASFLFVDVRTNLEIMKLDKKYLQNYSTDDLKRMNADIQYQKKYGH